MVVSYRLSGAEQHVALCTELQQPRWNGSPFSPARAWVRANARVPGAKRLGHKKREHLGQTFEDVIDALLLERHLPLIPRGWCGRFGEDGGGWGGGGCFQIFAFQTESTSFLSFKQKRPDLHERHVSKARIRGASAARRPPCFFCGFQNRLPTGILNLIQFADSSRLRQLQKGEFVVRM